MDHVLALPQSGHRQAFAQDGKARRRRRGAASAWALAAMMSAALLVGCNGSDHGGQAATPVDPVDQQLAGTLAQQKFTGAVEQKLETRLGRQIDPKLAELGRQLFFDRVTSLHNDSSCASCHSPTNGWADTQSIAIGIGSNLLVGPDREGPHNLRRSPSAANSAFYPSMMWDGRFFAPSGDPFDNAQGFTFPPPEGTIQFRPNDPVIKHLLAAQSYLPTTQFDEMAGFRGMTSFFGADLTPFDDGQGDLVPGPDGAGSSNSPIRDRVVQRVNAIPAYVRQFGEVFSEVRNGTPIDYSMLARALAEFQFTLRGANAPIDRFARGETGAMTAQEKSGALLFFGKANCVACHAVGGNANEMFSDFKLHNIGVPQIAPVFGVSGDVPFQGPGQNEDYGAQFATGQASNRYKFRTSPLRNVGLQPTFFHNGAFTTLDDAIRHHLDVLASLRNYDAAKAGVAPELAANTAPSANVAATLDPLLAQPLALNPQEISDLTRFVRTGLLDARMRPANACALVPKTLVSGMQPIRFEGCQ